MKKSENKGNNKKNNTVPESEIVTHQSVVVQDITGEMRTSYLDYAMSVITQRALPDVRDGLKPVHRRILYSMPVSYTHLQSMFECPYMEWFSTDSL